MIAVLVAVLVALAVGIGAWLWSGRGSHTDELGAYELPAQSDRRYTRDDIVAMVDDCNRQASAASGASATGDAAGADTATDEASGATAVPFVVEDAGADAAADANAHPPTTVTMTIPASESAEPRKSQPFRCMATALSMPAATQRDLVKQAGAFDREAGAMPMAWNELGFVGWKASDGAFHLRITWYDPAAQEE